MKGRSQKKQADCGHIFRLSTQSWVSQPVRNCPNSLGRPLNLQAGEFEHFDKCTRFDTGTSLQKAIHKVATFTTQVYQRVEALNGRKLAKYGRALKSQYMALESHIQREDENDVCSWHAKPKWHLAEHIFDLACMQQWALRRGGKRNASSEAEKTLLCFMNDTPPLNVNLPSSA